MDIVTQGLLGAALAQSVSRADERRRATVIGFLAGLAADADVFIHSSSDPLLTIEYHRHFTHSLVFIPAGALIVALLLWFFYRQKTSFQRLYVFSLLGYSMSGLLDACTSYGTYLFWPFSSEAVALRIISIIDPVFTLILLVAVLLVYIKQRAVYARVALLLAGSYMILGFVQLHRAESAFEQLALSRGHTPERLLAKPSFANILVWRGIYQHEGRYYIDAIRVTSSVKIYQGQSIEIFKPEQVLQKKLANTAVKLTADSIQYRDILRFEKFSQSWLVIHPDEPDVIGDIRYAMSPDSVMPLWGIRLDTTNPSQHATFEVFRKLGQEQRQHFGDMLLGR